MKSPYGELYLSNAVVPAIPKPNAMVQQVGGYTTEEVWLITRDNPDTNLPEYWALDASWGPLRPMTLFFQTTAQAKACAVGIRNFEPAKESLDESNVTQLITPPTE